MNQQQKEKLKLHPPSLESPKAVRVKQLPRRPTVHFCEREQEWMSIYSLNLHNKYPDIRRLSEKGLRKTVDSEVRVHGVK